LDLPHTPHHFPSSKHLPPTRVVTSYNKMTYFPPRLS
jgi:hypothetical protein